MNVEDIWAILEIEPTDDQDKIREAYREKLVRTNPEDDQEGFMALKEAYDEAIRLSESAEAAEEEEELSEAVSAIDDIYKDVNKRIDIHYWDELFLAPEFVSIDEQELIRNDFLRYTMGHYKYTSEVWKKIDDVMTIVRDADTLKDQFPEGYINFLVDTINGNGCYVLSEPVVMGRDNGVKEVNDIEIETDQEPLNKTDYICDVDNYIDNIEMLVREYKTIDNRHASDEYCKTVIDRLGADILMARQYDFYHPYEEIAVIKYLYYKERFEECFRLVEAAVERTVMAGEEHSDFYYSHLMFMYLRFFMQKKHRDMGLTITPERFAMCKNVIPKTMREVYINETHSAMSLCRYLEGEKREAADYMSYMSNYQRDMKAYDEFLEQIDDERLEELPEMIEKDPENLSLKLSLAWILSRRDRLDEAYDLIKDNQPGEEEYLDYYFFMGKYLMDKHQFKEAVPVVGKWKDALCEKYNPDTEYDLDKYSIREVRNINRISFAFYLLSIAYYDSGDLEKSKEIILKGLNYAKIDDYYDYAKIYDSILMRRKEYEEGVDFWSREIEKNNDYISICHGNRQYMAYKADRAREVIEDYFFLRYNDPKYADSYFFAEEIYLDYNDMEGFETCLRFIKENEVYDFKLDYNYARYLRVKGNLAESLNVFESIESVIDEDNKVMETPSAYYVSYAYCLMERKSKEKDFISDEEFCEKLESLIEKSRKCEDGNINAYWVEIDFRERYDKQTDLKPIYQEMLERFPDNGTVDYEYGMILKSEDNYELAGKYFESGLKKAPRHVNLHYELSDYYNDYRYKKLEETEYSLKAVEVSKELLDIKYDEETAVQYVLVLMDAMEYDKALEFADKAVEDFPEDPYVVNARGLIYKHIEKYEEAEADFKKAIELYKGENRFVSYTNLVNLYEKQNRPQEAAQAYLDYMEKFDQHAIGNYNRLAELYDRACEIDKAVEARFAAIRLKIIAITGKDPGTEIGLSISRIAYNYPDIAPVKFIDLISYMYDVEASYSLSDNIEKMDEIEAETMNYIEMIQLLRDVKDIPEGMRPAFSNALWAVAHSHLFVRRGPAISAKFMEKFIEVKEEKEPLVKYYDVICQSYDLLGRSYLFLGDSEKAAEAGRKAMEYVIKAHGSVENYINFKRYSPLYLTRLSGIYLAMGEKEKAFECLEMIDKCKKCSHCTYAICVDKTDRYALYAELDGEYEKAIELYEYGREYSGHEIEKAVGIRECRERLEKSRTDEES